MTVPGVYTPQQPRSGMTDDKLVEAVARAIYNRNPIRSGGNQMLWDQLPTGVRDLFFKDATAAIAAVRQHMMDDGK